MPSWLQWRRAKLKIKPSGSKVNSLTALCNVTSLGSFSSPTFNPALAALPCLLSQICPILLSLQSHWISSSPVYTVIAQLKPGSWVGSSRKLRAGLTRLPTKDFSHLARRWLEEAAGWGAQGAGEHQVPAEAAAVMGHALPAPLNIATQICCVSPHKGELSHPS